MTDLDAADGSALIPLPLRPGPWKSIDLDVKVGPEPKLVWSSKSNQRQIGQEKG
jgi:hypothetical protein